MALFHGSAAAQNAPAGFAEPQPFLREQVSPPTTDSATPSLVPGIPSLPGPAPLLTEPPILESAPAAPVPPVDEGAPGGETPVERAPVSDVPTERQFMLEGEVPAPAASSSSLLADQQPLMLRELFRTSQPAQLVVPRYEVDPTSPSTAGMHASANYLQQGGGSIPYNFKVGPVKFRCSAGVRVEFNDNITLSEQKREADLIVHPRVSVQGVWQATRQNTLRIDLGFSYAAYLAHPENNTIGMGISPGSEIAFDFFIGNFRLNLHDRFSIQQDPVTEATVSDVVNLARFVNNIGITVYWNLNRVLLSLGYDHIDSISLKPEFKHLNRSQDTIPFSFVTVINPAISAGGEGAVTFTRYTEAGAERALRTIHVGPFVQGRLSRFITYRAAAGVQYLDSVSSDETVTVAPTQDGGGWYANLTFAHRINSRSTQTLGIGHERQLGAVTSAEEINYLRYTLGWEILNDFTFGTAFFLEDVTAFGGAEPVKIWRYGGGVTLGRQITRKLHLGLQYQFVCKDAELPNQDYFQNRVAIDIDYQF